VGVLCYPVEWGTPELSLPNDSSNGKGRAVVDKNTRKPKLTKKIETELQEKK